MKGAFSIPAFRRLTGAWTIGNIADSALFLTLGIWAKDLSGSSSAAGLIFLALGLPVVVSPLVGALADRVRRRSLLIAANAVSAVVAATLLLVVNPGDLWLLYTVAFVYGLLGIVNGSAQSGLVRDMLPDEYLDSANGLLSTIDQGMRIFTPLVGAALYALWGGAALALSVAACLLLTAVLLLTVHVRESEPESAAERGSFWTENAAGFRHLSSVPLLLRMVIATAIALGVIGMFDSALFELVEKGLGQEPGFFGVLMSLQGAGSILGGMTAALLMRRVGPARAVGIGLALIGIAAFGCAIDLLPGAIARGALLPISLVSLFLAGVAVPWVFVSLVTTRQRLTPARLQGRTAAATNLVLNVPQLVAIGMGATLVAIVDYRWLLVAAGIVITAVAITMLTPRAERTSEPGSEPAPASAPAGAAAELKL